MSKAYVTIDTSNDAFHNEAGEYEPALEVARILRELADRLEQDPQRTRVPASDTNGHLVASLVIEKDPEDIFTGPIVERDGDGPRRESKES